MISHRYKFIFVHVSKTGGTSVEAAFGIGADFVNPEEPWDRRHFRLSNYREVLPPELFRTYFKFAFVRNPFDRLVSRWANLRDMREEKVLRRAQRFLDDGRLAQKNEVLVGKQELLTQKLELLAPKQELLAQKPKRLAQKQQRLRQKQERLAEEPERFWSRAKSHSAYNGFAEYVRRGDKMPRKQLVDFDGSDMAPELDFVGRFEMLADDFAFICKHVGADVTLPRLNKSSRTHYRDYYDDETREMVERECAHDLEQFRYTF